VLIGLVWLKRGYFSVFLDNGVRLW
jgi:hypothetical protein